MKVDVSQWDVCQYDNPLYVYPNYGRDIFHFLYTLSLILKTYSHKIYWYRYEANYAFSIFPTFAP